MQGWSHEPAVVLAAGWLLGTRTVSLVPLQWPSSQTPWNSHYPASFTSAHRPQKSAHLPHTRFRGQIRAVSGHSLKSENTSKATGKTGVPILGAFCRGGLPQKCACPLQGVGACTPVWESSPTKTQVPCLKRKVDWKERKGEGGRQSASHKPASSTVSLQPVVRFKAPRSSPRWKLGLQGSSTSFVGTGPASNVGEKLSTPALSARDAKGLGTVTPWGAGTLGRPGVRAEQGAT